MRVLILLALGLAAVLADPLSAKRLDERFIGGSPTDISNYPYAAAFQYYYPMFPQLLCIGTIINNRSVLSAAHCFINNNDIYNIPSQWRIRSGSTYHNREGYLHDLQVIIGHPSYDRVTFDSDIAIIRTTADFYYGANVAPASIAGTNYVVEDNSAVQAIGWLTGYHTPLRHVQTRTVNIDTCRARWAELGRDLTDNMLCTGLLDVADEGQCQGDPGSALLHNGVLVGIWTLDYQCALGTHPTINTKISSFTTWIQANA